MKDHPDGRPPLCYCILLSNKCIVPLGFLPWETQVAFPGESQLLQSRTTQPMVHAGCVNVSISHQTLTWTAGALTCTRILVRVIALGGGGWGVHTHLSQSALKVDWEKNPLPQWRIKPASVACQSDTSPIPLHPHPAKFLRPSA